MKEELLQYIWRSKLLISKDLQTTDGDCIEILHPGQFNTNQGPDFLSAKIKINKVLWVGHVEIHIKSSDWFLHKHQDDPNYQNTILHVVWNDDGKINWEGRSIPCLQMRPLIDEGMLHNYQMLMDNMQTIPCQ